MPLSCLKLNLQLNKENETQLITCHWHRHENTTSEFQQLSPTFHLVYRDRFATVEYQPGIEKTFK
jgi:hypothetical protein